MKEKELLNNDKTPLGFENKGIEIISKRGKREKHFLQKDGSFIAQMYSDDIHFKKNGKYEEIDNRLEKVSEYYKNKNNSFDVYFKERSKGELLRYELQEGYIGFELMDDNDVSLQIIDGNSKFTQTVKYENIFEGIDFEYLITPTKVKENIIIKEKEFIPEKISFILHTNFELKLTEDGNIAASIGDNDLFTLDVPYMIDSTQAVNNNIRYELNKQVNGYTLDIRVDEEWLNSNERLYPVSIDPTISTNDDGNVYDTYIYPGDTNVNRNGQDILKAGVERINGQDIVNRSLIKFELPTIGTGSQIYEAYLNLISYSIYSITNPLYIRRHVDVHRITSDWTESGANWANMNDKFDERIEVSFLSARSKEEYIWEGNVMHTKIIPFYSMANITALVKKWYTGTPNYGVMLNAHKEIYDSEMLPAFYSKNNQITGDDPKPRLEIVYRNQNGLENYMNYQIQPFNDGKIYENVYNGNLIAMFDLGTTVSGKLPASLNLIYNTNDVILNNDSGLGKGYKFNLWQTIKEEIIGNTNYLQYVDEDGTIHYFFNKNGIYEDEDGLNMTIDVNPDNYILRNKYGESMTFNKINNVGYLKQIKDVQEHIVSVNYNSNNYINQVIDADNQKIDIVYETNKISIISPSGTVVLDYTNDRISNICGIEGNTCFAYNENNLIEKVTDVDGTSVVYEYYTQKPYRIKKVIEYGNNNQEGAFFTVLYGNKSTSLIDNQNRTTIISFNDYGNPICTSDLKNKDDIDGASGTIHNYGEYDEYKNKILSNKIPVKHVKNYLKNISFEEDIIYFDSYIDVEVTTSDDCAYSGLKSLKISSVEDDKVTIQNISVPKGTYYTFSAYIKNTNDIRIKLGYLDANRQSVDKESNIIIASDEFNRHDVTIYYPEDAIGDLFIKIDLINSGVVYIDDVQLEEGEVANHFNYIENSDFSNGLGNLECDSDDENPNRFQVVTLPNGHSKALKIVMDPEYGTQELLKFNLSGEKGDEYNISFWYKNKGTSPDSLAIVNGCAAWLLASYIDPDDWHTQHCVPITHLNPNEDEWQYFSASYITEAAYDGFKVVFQQDNDANELYITNLSLFKSISSNMYDYDKNGNLTSVIGNNKEVNIFEYDANSQLVNSINPKGKRLMYEYDCEVPDRLISSISEIGVCSKIKYDSNNNPILTSLNKKGITGEITNGIYKIRVKGSDLYFHNIMNSIKLTTEFNNSDFWKLERVEDYFKISNSLIPNKYFSVHNGRLVLSGFNGDKSLFTLSENKNGSYSLILKSDNKYVKNEDNTLVISELIEEDSGFEFYFESTDEEKFIETNTEYTEDGRLIKNVVDTNFNKLIYDMDQLTGATKSTRNARGQTSFYEYDDEHRLTSIVVEGKRKVNYAYNENNYLEKIIFGTKEYNFIYDEFMNHKSLAIGNTPLIINNYEAYNGNLNSVTYGNGDVVSYEYDEFDRTKTITKMDNKSDFKYGNNGDLLKVITNDSIINFAYDLGKRLTEYKTDKYKFQYSYDINSNITNKKYNLGTLCKTIGNVFDEDDNLTKTTFENSEINYLYDKLGRLNNSNISNILNNNYEYITNGKRTSMLVSGFTINNNKYYYKYDKLNNITHIYCNDILENRYYYNEYNELIKEDNYLTNETIKYNYDDCGNILFKQVYELNTNNLICRDKYVYNNTSWEDLLTKFNNQIITYDEIGNPLTIGESIALDWINGKQLNTYSDNKNLVTYKYDYTGTRIGKTVNGTETKFYLEETKIIFEETNDSVIYYIYDNVGGLIGFIYNNNLYYYVKNYQNDIIAILDSIGNVIVKYQYDSWGNHISIKDANDSEITDVSHVGLINPFRYRSYYFDKETGLYYLNSRYYNPLWGRFLNADSMLVQTSSLTGYNLFIYGNNNPINRIDSKGNFAWGVAALVVTGIIMVGAALYAASKNKKKKKQTKKTSSGSSSTSSSSSKTTSKKVSTSGSKSTSSSFVAALPAAGVATTFDGPLPVFEIVIGATLLVLAIKDIATIIENATVSSTSTPSKEVKPCTRTWFNNSSGNIGRGERLTIDQSVTTVKMGESVMCDDHSSAFAVASQFPGMEGDYPHNKYPGQTYYYHYHPDRRGHTHIWFYGEPPQYYKDKYFKK